MFDVVRIPDERKGVLIGKDGETKKMLEGKTNTRLSVNDAVEIEGDSLDVMKTKEIVKAIGRGFSPEIALKLLDDSYQFVIINLGQETYKTQKRILSRIIGRKGKCKNIIEKCTGVDIVVYGKTISIIGEWSKAGKAEHAIDMLIEGKQHGPVYKYLEGSE